MFLEHCFRWLRPGGVLVLVIPGKRIASCSDVLAPHFRDLGIYRLTEPEAARYSQVAVFGIRRTRRERERLHDRDVSAAQELLFNIGRNYARLSPLPDEPDRVYSVPSSAPNVRLTYRGLPMDVLEDLLPSSSRLPSSRTDSVCARSAGSRATFDTATRRSRRNFELLGFAQWRIWNGRGAPCRVLGNRQGSGPLRRNR